MSNIIIGICGGSGSGKTTIVNKILESVSEFSFVPQDNYYKSADHISNENITSVNFDHPNAIDSELLYKHLKALKNNESVKMPQYDFVHHKRKEETVEVTPSRIIIFEGIMIFSEKKIRDIIDIKLFIDTPSDIRFIRRLQRDIEERGRTVESVISQYIEVVRPGHFEFIEPTKEYADLIIPEGGQNKNVLNILTSFINTIIERK